MDKKKFTLIDALSVVQEFTPGQSLDKTIELVKKNCPHPRYEEKDLLDMIRQVNPEYAITAKDRAEQKARREVSEKARNELFKFVHNRSEVMKGKVMNRGLELLLDFSGSPEAKTHNERIFNAFAKNDEGKYINPVDERTKILEEFIDKMEQEYDMSKYYGMSDKDLAEKFVGIYPLFLLGMEGGNSFLSNNKKELDHYHLGERYVKKLEEFRDLHQGQMSMLAARFDMIINPNYEIVHYERFVPDAAHEPSMIYNDDERPIVDKMKNEDPSLFRYANTFMVFQANRGISWRDRVGQHIRPLGMDIDRVETYDIDGNLRDCRETFGLDGVTMIRVSDKLSGREILLKSDGVELYPVNTENAPEQVRNNCEDILKDMEEADPWHIRNFTGSKEYGLMKKAMKATVKLMKSMPNEPSPEQREAINNQLKALEDLASKYLETKNPLNENTKESERLRVNAANSALRLVSESKMLLDNQQHVMERKAGHHKFQNEIMNQFKRVNNPDAVQTNGAKAQPTNNLRLETLNKKMHNFYMKPLKEGDQLLGLSTDICNGFSDLTKLPAKPVEQVAKMVAFDLIMRERVAQKGTGGPIEQAYLAKPDVFCSILAKTDALQSIAKNMNVAGMQRFLESAVENKVMTLSNKALRDMGSQKNPQIQKDAPVVSKADGFVRS